MAKRGTVIYRLPNGKFTPEYISWIAMKQRCLNPKAEKYPSYGGKGITVCRSWLLFANFLRDIGPRPDGYTLDRKDGTGNYELGNCRWATAQEQADNSDTYAKGWKRNKTTCPSGHLYEGDNLRITAGGGRKCRQCELEEGRKMWIKHADKRILKGNFQTQKTHCKNGHEFTPENTRVKGNHRKCRACDRETASRQRLKKRKKIEPSLSKSLS